LCEKDAGKIRIRVIYGDMGHTGSACTLPDNSLMLNRSELSWLRRAAFDPTQAQAIKGKREPQQQRERGAGSDSYNPAKSTHEKSARCGKLHCRRLQSDRIWARSGRTSRFSYPQITLRFWAKELAVLSIA
jgi:hypothetical protein